MEITKTFVTIAAAVAVFFILLMFLGMNAGGRAPEDLDAFAQCLGSSGARMYGASWCGHCQDQKDMFGESWDYIDYVECSGALGGQNPLCLEEGISGYPTWVFPELGQKPGTQTFEKLSEYSGCPLDA